jgi:hypothetical protein
MTTESQRSVVAAQYAMLQTMNEQFQRALDLPTGDERNRCLANVTAGSALASATMQALIAETQVNIAADVAALRKLAELPHE